MEIEIVVSSYHILDEELLHVSWLLTYNFIMFNPFQMNDFIIVSILISQSIQQNTDISQQDTFKYHVFVQNVLFSNYLKLYHFAKTSHTMLPFKELEKRWVWKWKWSHMEKVGEKAFIRRCNATAACWEGI